MRSSEIVETAFLWRQLLAASDAGQTPKLSCATPDSHSISVVKVKTAFANNVPTLFEHRMQRFGCIHRTFYLRPVVVHRKLAQRIEHKAKYSLLG